MSRFRSHVCRCAHILADLRQHYDLSRRRHRGPAFTRLRLPVLGLKTTLCFIISGPQLRQLHITVKMVCTKCQKLEKQTELATPVVKKKNELYYGSPALAATNKQSKPSAILGNAGIGKV